MFACLGREGEVIPPGSLHHWKTILAVSNVCNRSCGKYRTPS